MDYIDYTDLSEEEARGYLEGLRWPKGPVCLFCGNKNIARLNGKKHLQRYCDEFAFRWDHRKVSDHVRTEAALKAAPGKRLLYRQPRS